MDTKKTLETGRLFSTFFFVFSGMSCHCSVFLLLHGLRRSDRFFACKCTENLGD